MYSGHEGTKNSFKSEAECKKKCVDRESGIDGNDGNDNGNDYMGESPGPK